MTDGGLTFPARGDSSETTYRSRSIAIVTL